MIVPSPPCSIFFFKKEWRLFSSSTLWQLANFISKWCFPLLKKKFLSCDNPEKSWLINGVPHFLFPFFYVRRKQSAVIWFRFYKPAYILDFVWKDTWVLPVIFHYFVLSIQFFFLYFSGSIFFFCYYCYSARCRTRVYEWVFMYYFRLFSLSYP